MIGTKAAGATHARPHAPAAFSMLSSVTQLASATCTFSCSTSLTLSTLFITAASLSTSSRLSYLGLVGFKGPASAQQNKQSHH
jgi:hypothetical protein